MHTRSKQSRQPKEMFEADYSSFVHALNDVLPSYILNSQLEICYSFHKKAVNTQVETKYKTEKIALCNMKVELWDAAVLSVIRDTTEDRYPHFTAVQSILNYVLNEHKYTDFGLASEALSRLLHFHSPVKQDMKDYYLHIIQDPYASAENVGLEGNIAFFKVLIEIIYNHQADMPDYFTFSTFNQLPETFTDEIFDYQNLNKLQGKNKLAGCEKVINPTDKLKRAMFCLNFICEIFEQNCIGWMRENEGVFRKKPPYQSLLECFLWPDLRSKGHITPFIHRLIALQKRAVEKENVLNHCFEKLITLTSEVLRAHDRLVQDTYPFIGELSWDLARELALLVIDEINNDNENGSVDYLTRLKPSWLRMIVTSRVLGDMAGFQCEPELLSVITVLENLEQIYKLDQFKNRSKENKNALPADPTLVARFQKLKSVNGLLRSGLSRLHTACKENNVVAVRALLTLPCLDLNLKDDTGCTPLHRAVMKDSKDCVRELLEYIPRIDQVQRRIDTRARGPGGVTPLMQAAQGDHDQICSLLLKHTGSVLLEDINDDNATALDLCIGKNTRKELLPYKLTNIETINSKKEVKFATVHRTWDVYLAVKSYVKSGTAGSASPKLTHNYDLKRYYRDFKTNITKLRQMVGVLRKFDDLSSVNDVLFSIVSSNKS